MGIRCQSWHFWVICCLLVGGVVWAKQTNQPWLGLRAADAWAPPTHLVKQFETMQARVEDMPADVKQEYEVYAQKLFVKETNRILTIELQKIADGSWRD